MKKIILSICIFLFSLLTLANAFGKVSGLVESVASASEDFERRLKLDIHDWEYADYVADIHNYSVGFADAGTHYVVVFRLIPPGVPIAGGGGQYWIEKKSFKVMRFVGEE